MIRKRLASGINRIGMSTTYVRTYARILKGGNGGEMHRIDRR